MGIHVCILLCIENEEEVIVEEETAHKLKFHQSRTVSTLIFVEQIPSLLQHKASLGAFTLPCCFKLFITWNDALGDRSCVLNNCCIPFLGTDYHSLIPIYLEVFWCLDLPYKKCFVLNKDDASYGMGSFQRKDLMVNPSWPWWVWHRKRCTSARYQTLGYKW